MSFLPRELRQIKGLFDPSGGISFDLSHHVPQLVSRLQAHQKVNVIVNSSGRQGESVLVPNDGSQIGVNP
tara:strand:- start:2511 stop:2720 length:210 start_codon:yes stop_codon:yes gene_type:complete